MVGFIFVLRCEKKVGANIRTLIDYAMSLLCIVVAWYVVRQVYCVYVIDGMKKFRIRSVYQIRLASFAFVTLIQFCGIFFEIVVFFSLKASRVFNSVSVGFRQGTWCFTCNVVRFRCRLGSFYVNRERCVGTHVITQVERYGLRIRQ